MPNPRMPISFLSSQPHRSLKSEKCRLLYDNTLMGILLSLIFAVILSVSHLKETGTGEIITWNLILFSTLTIRFILWVSWRLAAPILPSSLWLHLGRIGIWLTGLSWGVSTLFLFSHSNDDQQTLFAFALAGVIGCSLPFLSADKFSAIGYVLLAITPLTALLLEANTTASFYMALMTITFIFFILKKADMDEKNIHELFFTKRVLIKKNAFLQTNHVVDTAISETIEEYIETQNADQAIKRLINTLCEKDKYQFAVLLTNGALDQAIVADNISSVLFLEVLEKNPDEYYLADSQQIKIVNDLKGQGLDTNPKAIFNYAIINISPAYPYRLIIGNKRTSIRRKDILVEKKIFHSIFLLLLEKHKNETASSFNEPKEQS